MRTIENTTTSALIKKILYSLDLFDFILLTVPLVLLLLMLYHPILDVITPFLFGAIVAYMLSPLVNLVHRWLRMPKFIATIFVYCIFVGLIIVTFARIVILINLELRQLTSESSTIPGLLEKNIREFPLWAQSVFEFLTYNLKSIATVPQMNTLPVLRNTFERIIQLFIFFVSSFYFLKDKDRIPHLIRSSPLIDKISNVLKGYLRGQLILIVFVSAVTYIFLTLIHVRFALLVSIFTGFAETIPFIGPFAAAFVAMTVVFATGTDTLQHSVPYTALIVGLGYFVIRQIEDFLIAPIVVGRSVEIHPLIVMFTTLFFGKLFGFIGLLIGVPFIAVYKVLVEHALTSEK